MKKLNFLYIIISLSVLTVSCGKDDDPKVDPVVGKWDMENIKLEILGNTKLSNAYNHSFSVFEFFYIFYGVEVSREILELKEDKSFTFETRKLLGGSSTSSGKWTKTNTTLTLKYDKSDDEEYSIITSDEDVLKMSLQFSQNWVDPSDTTKAINADTKYTYTFNK